MNTCENCRHYCLKKPEDRKKGYKGYCKAFTLPIYAKTGYVVDRMYRYGEVPLNGSCDKWEGR